jgi:hypothetical protein
VFNVQCRAVKSLSKEYSQIPESEAALGRFMVGWLDVLVMNPMKY